MSSAKAKLGGLLLRPALGGLREEIDPEGQGGATCWACAGSGWCRMAGFTRRGFAQAILRAQRGAREDSDRAHARGAGAGGSAAKRRARVRSDR